LQVLPQLVPVRGVVGPHRWFTQVPLLVHGLLSMSVQSTSCWQQNGLGTCAQCPIVQALSVQASASSGQVDASAQA